MGLRSGPNSSVRLTGRHQASVAQKLMTKPEAFAQYRECLQQILFVPIEVTQQDWVNVISSKLLLLAATFHDAEGAAIHRDGHRYLAWEPAPRAIEVGESGGSLVNT